MLGGTPRVGLLCLVFHPACLISQPIKVDCKGKHSSNAWPTTHCPQTLIPLPLDVSIPILCTVCAYAHVGWMHAQTQNYTTCLSVKDKTFTAAQNLFGIDIKSPVRAPSFLLHSSAVPFPQEYPNVPNKTHKKYHWKKFYKLIRNQNNPLHFAFNL